MTTSHGDGESSDFPTVLGKIRNILEEKNWPVVFHNGLSRMRILRQEKRCGFALHPDVVALYEWCNGWEPGPGVFPEFSLLPLQSAINEAQEQRLNGLALLSNGGGDYLYVAARAQSGPMMVHRVLSQIFAQPLYDSLHAFFSLVMAAHAENMLEVYDQAAMLLDERNQYTQVRTRATRVAKLPQLRSIYARLNPQCAPMQKARGMLW